MVGHAGAPQLTRQQHMRGDGPANGEHDMTSKRNRTFLAIGTGIAACAAAMPAAAQDSGQSAEDIIVTAVRENRTLVSREGNLGALGNKDALETPFAVKSYNAALILNQQPLTLGDVLQNDPAVRTSLGFANASETFVIRGFPLYGEDIAIDGLYGITPRQLVSPELYDQVQVLNGASAFLFGAAPGGSALGGTVNLQLKRAGTADTTRITGNYLSDGHVGGSFDVGRRFGADDSFGVRVNGAGRWGDVAIEDEYRSSTVVGMGTDWRSDRARLSLDLAFQRAKVRHMRPMVQFGGATAVPDAPDASRNYGQEWNYTTLRDIFGIVKFEYDLADNVMAYASLGAKDSAERGMYQSFQLTDAETGDGYVTGSNIPRNDNNEAGQAGIRASFATGGLTHEFNVGVSHSRYVNRNAYVFGSSQSANNLYDPVQVPEPVLEGGFSAGDLGDPTPASRTRLTSAFASDTLGALDDTLLLTLGLRRQTVHVRSYDLNTGEQGSRYEDSTTTPVVGMVYRPSPFISIYANRIEALAPGSVASGDVLNVGEVFPPYKSTQYEVGAKAGLGNLLNASLALFQTSQPQELTEPCERDGMTGTCFTLNGEQRNRGVEFSVDGEPVKGFRVIAGVAVTDAEQRETQDGATDGLNAIGVPDYTANLNVEWDTPFVPGLTLTGRVIQTGQQMADADNTLELDSWTRFDLGARYVVAAGTTPVTFRVNVDNVANEGYWASSLGGYLVQGAPRTFKLSATVDF